MRIEELHIQNFRGFKELTLKFPPNLAVLIGVNGSGKSSVLDCIALFLSILASAGQIPDSPPQSITVHDITNGFEETHNQLIVLLENSRNLDLSLTQNREMAHRLYYGEEFKSTLFYGHVYGEGSNVVNATKEFYEYIQNKLRQDSYANIPLVTYYSSDRKAVEFPLKSYRKHESNQLSAYIKSVDKKVDFADFFIWFRNEEDLENEIRLDNDPAYVNKHLQAVREAIPSLMPEFSNLKVRRSPLRMIVSKQEQELVIDQLSDGEKNLLAMVGDLARRLAIANPSLENPLQGSGIVLIDEIELHLHPQWQRRIIPALTQTFPNLQFIVTTHSPQVLSNVRKENVFILEDFKLVENTPYTYGRDSNSILFELMNVKKRPDESQKQIDKCFYLIDEGRIEEAKKELQKLSDLLGEHDSEVVEANALISFLTDGDEANSNEAYLEE
ncbi:ATPase AAA-type core domain-containing protein [Tumidithrix helvetica PCC 7403]|uniref:AAA family ATPase n=1 Tax=Tumidithrix helvetica TaxID=3457545 RepID=UPI003C9A155B